MHALDPGPIEYPAAGSKTLHFESTRCSIIEHNRYTKQTNLMSNDSRPQYHDRASVHRNNRALICAHTHISLISIECGQAALFGLATGSPISCSGSSVGLVSRTCASVHTNAQRHNMPEEDYSLASGGSGSWEHEWRHSYSCLNT